jgi:hypothetical protein
VSIEMRNVYGRLLATIERTLRPRTSIQIDRVIEELSEGPVEEGYLVVSSSTPDALFFAYASVVDNQTGDGIYIPAVVD